MGWRPGALFGCPAGHGKYEKLSKTYGKCMKEPTDTEPLEGTLVEKGILNFQCPEHHISHKCRCNHIACQNFYY